MTPLQEALINWQSTQPNADCCKGGHFIKSGMRWRDRRDEDVCKRELAWRKYVRLRDHDETWPSKYFDIIADEELP